MSIKSWFKAPMFSPAGFLVRAAILAALYGLLSVCGLREYTSVLSVTFHEGTSQYVSMFLFLLYALSYFSFILLVPILVIAAGLFALIRRGVKA